MRFLFLSLGFLLGSSGVYAQQDPLPPVQEGDSIRIIEADSLQTVETPSKETDTLATRNNFLRYTNPKEEKTRDSVTIKDYKIVSYARDTTYVDTTLTIQKEYKHNYLRKDDFELMPFANIGQPYNVLGKTFSQRPYYPRMGATAKHYNYFEIEDIPYHQAPTPMTELMFKTTLEEGQLLDALLTFNLSKQFNASIAYKGFRSLGKYLFEEVESENFRTTLNYTTPDNRYTLRAHIAAQAIDSEENGGLRDREQFEGGDEDFTDRARIDVKYTDANNRLLGKRYFLDHQLALMPWKRDTTGRYTPPLLLGHELTYETKLYDFTQANQNEAFGQDPFVTPIEDSARLQTLFNSLYTGYTSPTLGNLKGSVSLYHYNYFFNSILITEQGIIPNQLQGQEIAIGGSYAKTIERLSLQGDFGYTLSGDLTGNTLNAQANYQIGDNYTLRGAFHLSSRMPDFNYLLYQSDYRNFNWHNAPFFKKQQVQNLQLGIHSQKIGLLEAAYSILDNYTYFASAISAEQIANGEQATAFVQPFQETNPVKHLRIKYTKEFRWRKWALMNTVLYQNVAQDQQVLNLPQWLTRNTLYFSSDVFKKAMFLQTGFTFKYFTTYNMDAYNPLLGEFFIQNNEAFGGYPLLDVFINAKVRQTRIYLKAEHLNSILSPPEYFSAPDYPYRDFVIRFGLVWNFFS